MFKQHPSHTAECDRPFDSGFGRPCGSGSTATRRTIDVGAVELTGEITGRSGADRADAGLQSSGVCAAGAVGASAGASSSGMICASGSMKELVSASELPTARMSLCVLLRIVSSSSSAEAPTSSDEDRLPASAVRVSRWLCGGELRRARR